MILYIIVGANKVSDRYHEDGSLAVVADDEESARALVAAEPGVSITDAEWSAGMMYSLSGAYEPRVFVFPNAGCC